MDKTLWFKRKTYGWGWQPANVKGWVTLFIYSLVVIAALLRLQHAETVTGVDIVTFLGIVLIATLALICICYKKGESPKWQWGEESTEE